MTTLLALDASTTAVGWAVFQDGEYRKSGVYVPPKGAWWVRVRAIGAWVNYHLSYWNVGTIGYELATGRHGNVHTDRVLGAVEYAVRCSVYLRVSGGSDMIWPCEFATVTASQVKVSGCNKDALEVARSIKGAPLDDKHAGDEADAIGVGLAALKILKEAEWEAMA